MPNLAKLDAVAQAALVRDRRVTPLELVEAAIARIERLDPRLNAVVSPLFDAARDAARSPHLPDGPLRGVPFLLKDLGAQLIAAIGREDLLLRVGAQLEHAAPWADRWPPNASE